MRLTAMVLAALLAAVLPAGATTVTVERDGIAVERAEVCRFPAGDSENPFRRWLASQDVECSTAGSIAFPSGLWNAFARSGDAISAAPVLVDGDAAPQKISFSLDPSATVVTLLPDGSGGIVYVPRRGSAFPLRSDGRASVPAGEEMWLIVMEKSVLAAIVPIAAIERGAERTIDARHGGPAAIIGWLQVPERERTPMANARGLSAPAVRAVSGGATRDADPLPPLDVINGAFFRIRGPAAGNGELSIGGRGFVPQRQPLRVESAVTVAAEPLTVRASGTLVVNWTASPGTVALERSLGACARQEPPRFVISISACPPPERPGGSVDPATCTLFREESFRPDLSFGTVTLDDIATGVYQAEIRFGKLPHISTITSVVPLQVRQASLYATYLEVYGSVTHGGDAIDKDVVITFPGGYGFQPKGSDEYRAAFLEALGPDAQFKVGACDGPPQAVVLSDRPLRPNQRFDIDIPANELTVDVSDTFTHEALDQATVRLTVMSLSLPRRPVMTRTVTTASDDREHGGRATFETLPPGRDIRLSVSHSGYQRREIDPFSLTKADKKTVDVQLVPLRGSQARIVSDGAFESGAVVWFSPAGIETEHVELSPDGTFVYASPHQAVETMAVVSASHPLWVSHSPKLDHKQTVSVLFPNAPAADVSVTVRGGDGRDTRHIGVVIGGVRVPPPVLRRHQMMRRLPALIRGSGPLRLRDLLAIGPIDILLGPTVEEVTSRVMGMDFFALPQFASPPSQRLAPPASEVVFELPR